ncbi:MAG: type III PLP-dependent enzyme [Phycisphaerae bacterium]
MKQLSGPVLKSLAKKEGTPLFIVDHEQIRRNYRRFKKALPRVQTYYAVKANCLDAIIKTLFLEGASFDVASFPEFMQVHKYIKSWDTKKRHAFIYDKIIFSNTIKDEETLLHLRPYRPLVTYDNEDEIKKIKKYCDTAGLVLRLSVPDTGSMVEMTSKFGADPAQAMDLIAQAFKSGLIVEGLSFHVGSQCTNFDNYVQALHTASQIFREANARGYGKKMNIIDLGGGFPVSYNESVPQFEKLARIINSEISRLFPEEGIEIIAEPGRFMVANAATLVSRIIGRARRSGKRFYHINDGVYHTYSGIVFDHCVYHVNHFPGTGQGKKEICAVVGPTCDGFDKISMEENLPGNLKIGDLLYTENIGAYSIVSSTNFNGFSPAKVVHINL